GRGRALSLSFSVGGRPQVRAVSGRRKAILSGRVELYDVAADPLEAHDLAAREEVDRPVKVALRDYPVPSLQEPPPVNTLGAEELRKLASLGYLSASAPPA